ncbi:MAG: hypothetical protein WBB74_09155 [Gaiellaceae bacterium]
MGIFGWLRRLGPNRDEETVEREEFGGPDPGEADLERMHAAAWFPAIEASEVAEDDLKESEGPHHPAP